MSQWLKIAGAIAAFALLAGAYAFGRSDGSAIEIAKQAAIDAVVKVERQKREDLVDQAGAAAAVRETARGENVREIYRESQTVVEKPVYRNVCVDADGVHLLDRAALVAAGADPGILPAEAGATAPGPARP